jgi:hypothetical protein
MFSAYVTSSIVCGEFKRPSHDKQCASMLQGINPDENVVDTILKSKHMNAENITEEVEEVLW